MNTREKGSDLPINYDEQFAAEVSQIAKRVSAPSGDRLRTNGSRGFVLPNGDEGETLEVVIVDFVSSNAYYESAFDRNNPQPPGCFAVGPEPTTLQPVEESPAKQAESCSTCPHNQWGSSGKGKACKNARLIAVTPANHDEEEGDRPVWIYAIPPTSITFFDKYVRDAAAKYKRPPIGVVTRMSLDKSQTFAAPRFQVVSPVENEELGEIMSLRDTARERLMATPDFSSYTPPAAPARGTRR